MNQSLIQRAQDRIALWQLLEETNGELNETLEAWIAEVEGKLATKVDSYKFILDELDNESDRLREEVANLSKAAKSIERVSDAVKERIKYVMHKMDVCELKGEMYRFRLSPSAGRLVIDESELDSQYRMLQLVVDKGKILEDLNHGIAVPGAEYVDNYSLRTYVNKGNK